MAEPMFGPLGLLAGAGLGAGIGAHHAGKGHRLRGALLGALPGAYVGHSLGSIGDILARERAGAGAWTPPHESWSHAPPGGGYGHHEWGGAGFEEASPPHAENLHDVAPWLKDVGSRAEAKSRFRQQARQAHPDVGGTTTAMQQLNDQWERAQAHPDFGKLASAYVAGRQAALARFSR